MMARSLKAPSTGRIQKRKTNFSEIVTFSLQRAAGWANRRHDGRMSSGGDVPCVDVLRAALTVHLTATGI